MTPDVSVFEAKVTSGVTHAGCDDFDSRMVTSFDNGFNHKKDISGNVRAVPRLRTVCACVKRNLSSSANASIDVDQLYDVIYFYASISRAKFEELYIDPFKQTITPVECVLLEAKLEGSDAQGCNCLQADEYSEVVWLLKDFFNGKVLNQSTDQDETITYEALSR